MKKDFETEKIVLVGSAVLKQEFGTDVYIISDLQYRLIQNYSSFRNSSFLINRGYGGYQITRPMIKTDLIFPLK